MLAILSMTEFAWWQTLSLSCTYQATKLVCLFARGQRLNHPSFCSSARHLMGDSCPPGTLKVVPVVTLPPLLTRTRKRLKGMHFLGAETVSWVSFSIGSFGSNIIIVPNLQNFDGQGYRYKQHIFGLGMMLIAYIFKLYGLGFKFSLPLSNIPMLAILLPILPLISWSCSTAIFQFRPHLLRIRALALKIISLS